MTLGQFRITFVQIDKDVFQVKIAILARYAAYLTALCRFGEDRLNSCIAVERGIGRGDRFRFNGGSGSALGARRYRRSCRGSHRGIH